MRKSALLATAGAGALAVASLAISPGVRAQAFQASPAVVQGAVNIDRTVPGQDTISVTGFDAVVDWTPDLDNFGNALPFLPDGFTAIFQNDAGSSNFAIINRILPSPNGNVVQINGTVVSRLLSASGASAPGGHVMFYSPTGIIIGETARFDVGGLVLTTLAPDISAFGDFATDGAAMTLGATPGSGVGIEVKNGAEILATPEGSYVVMAGEQIAMGGLADVNGSVVYAAGSQMSFRHFSGLFDIVISSGAAGQTSGITHTGTTTGPAENGSGDNHVIYAAIRAQDDPITMLLTGSMGYRPANSAFVENGDIVLAANFDIAGKTVAEGSVGFDLEFEANNRTSSTAADISITNATITSRLLAAGTHRVSAGATAGATTFARDVVLFGAEEAALRAVRGGLMDIGGSAYVLSHDYGQVAPLSPDTAQGGHALVEAS
ncbi:MAG: filamentous hemagglutinin N-terminal domain-containing protein, partial [Alteraurantiacibacter sp.]|nr:filamentous hemagglutinin N-terminal domain-containing protein [Alteraurantiacibacter sp.]